jgi:hypothetical protein
VKLANPAPEPPCLLLPLLGSGIAYRDRVTRGNLRGYDRAGALATENTPAEIDQFAKRCHSRGILTTARVGYVAKFYYGRTKRVVEIPDDQAHIYENRRHYQRLDDPITVPEGSVAAVLNWVGDDPARRRAALEAERRGKARVTLIERLR